MLTMRYEKALLAPARIKICCPGGKVMMQCSFVFAFWALGRHGESSTRDMHFKA